MNHESLTPPSDPWPSITRLPGGELELSFDAPLTAGRRVDWLRTRDWIAKTYSAAFCKPHIDPISRSWSVSVIVSHQDHQSSALFGSADFPDDLILRVRDVESEWLINDASTRLRHERPDLGDLTHMNRAEFEHWLSSIPKTIAKQ
ncbi:MAG: hypothetical protein K2Y21_01880 [Phycisphaerales bacterium]|nr:hypothetical protein [Phycisphaerales bacterium]